MAVRPKPVAAGKTVNLSSIIDAQPLNRFSLSVFALCFLAMISDGYDLGVIGIGAPTIVKDFGISREAMSPIFSAALLGISVGALSSGFLGDRLGRKRCIIGACLLIGVATALCGISHNFDELLILRFLTGVGLGGLYPNTTAMMAEIMPARVRGAFTAYVFMGITVGGVIPGAVSAAFVGDDWRMMFFIGAAIPFALVPFLMAFLPESLKLLALKPHRKPELLKWLGKLCPRISLPSEDTYVLNEKARSGVSVAILFEGNRRLITPILWVAFIAIMLANFFINSYLTIVLRSLGFSTAEASLTASLFYAGGICGGLLIGPAMDWMGPMVLAVYALIGIVSAAVLAMAHTDHIMVQALVASMGFVVLASNLGLNAVVGMLYPTAVRSIGTGFCHSIGRIGAIGGPLIAGLLMAGHVDSFRFFVIPIVPLLAALISAMLVTRLWIGKVTPEKMERHLV